MQLFKFKLTAFVVISAVFGYFIGAPSYNFSEVVILMIGGFLVTSSSNAFNQAMWDAFPKLLDEVKADSGIRVLVLRAACPRALHGTPAISRPPGKPLC